jgi:hypothetical protein
MLDRSSFGLKSTVLFLWGALSNERTGLSFVYAAGPCQRSLSWVRVPWDSRPSFTISDLRLPFTSPPTTRRVTVEVLILFVLFITPQHGPHRKHSASIVVWISLRWKVSTQSLCNSGCARHVSYGDNSSVIVCGQYLATAVSLALNFLLWANTPQ